MSHKPREEVRETLARAAEGVGKAMAKRLEQNVVDIRAALESHATDNPKRLRFLFTSRLRFRITARWDPWFNLGFHLDHWAPYLAVHLPGVCVTIGWQVKPVYSVSCGPSVWIILRAKPSKSQRRHMQRALDYIMREVE